MSLELRPRDPCDNRLARSFGTGRHAVQDIGRKSNHRAPVARRGLGLVAGIKLQLAAFILRRIAELHRNRKLAPRPQGALIDMPVVMAAFGTVIDGILQMLGKAADSELIDAVIES